MCAQEALWTRWSQAENIFSLKSHGSFPNSSARNFKLHFPIAAAATMGHTNSSVWWAPFKISHDPLVLFSWIHQVSPVSSPLFPSKAEWNTGFKIFPTGIHQRSHLLGVPWRWGASDASLVPCGCSRRPVSCLGQALLEDVFPHQLIIPIC